MRHKKLSKSDQAFWVKYGIDPGVPDSGGMTTEQLGEALLQTVQQMSPDEKAHLRAKMNRGVGIEPKSSGGKTQ
jgi:hypothetical protein